MFAVCSISPNVNGVRTHVREMKKKGWKHRVVQIPTNDYRTLHRLKNNGEAGALMEAVMEMENTHLIDVDELTIHKIDCDNAPDDCVHAAINDMKTAGLTKCACLS